MKTIKIKICNYDPQDPFSLGNFLINILKKYYVVELSENPEYIFFSESDHEHLKYDGVKIFFTGENVTPNFNLTDYAVGFDYITFQDRYYRLPLYLVTVFYSKEELAVAGDPDFTKQKQFLTEELAQKTEFCSFVYSNYLSEGERQEFFNKLSAYKKVNAGGGFLNNVGGRVANKLEFEMKHKFSIAFENSSRSGYTTEKIVNSLVARTIPIYWGNPDIGKEFNERRFINCHAYKNFDEVVERVKEIDQNDELYLSMINEPIASTYDFKSAHQGFDDFLRHIIDQPLPHAKRRTINPMRARELERNEKINADRAKEHNARKGFWAKLYRPFKKIPLIEKVKQLYFKHIYLSKK